MEDTPNHTMNSEAAATPWIQCLDEILQEDPDGSEAGISKILRQMLSSSQDDSAPAKAARQIDAYYQNDYLSSNPLLKSQDDKGMGGFLSGLYEMVFDLARSIPHDNELQNCLVQFLVELAKQPTKEVQIWGEKCLVYARNPVYTVIMDDNWNGSYPSTASNPESPATLKRYAEWVNFSAFVARVIKTGHDDRFANWDKYPSFDIAKGLEEDSDKGPRRDCLILAATQYLLTVGEKLHREYVAECAEGSDQKQKGLDLWRLWANKLRGIAEGQTSTNPEVIKAAQESWQLMVSLEPSVQSESHEGTPEVLAKATLEG